MQRPRQPPRFNPFGSRGPAGSMGALLDGPALVPQAVQFAAFLAAAGYDAAYVAAANAAAAQAAATMGRSLGYGGIPPMPEHKGLELEPGQYKVSKLSVPKSVAGKIATDIRIGTLPALVAKGDAVAVATKAIALACTYLNGNGVMLSCSPYHKNDGDNETGRTVVFVLKKIPIQSLDLAPNVVKVARTSKTGPVAGSIAKTIRKGEQVTIQSLGPACIGHTVDSIVVARRMLRDVRCDISFVPKFVTLPVGDKTVSALQFHILWNQETK